ncbi:hypothetical protein RJZ56_004755 [Blastomyces dermatitidis]
MDYPSLHDRVEDLSDIEVVVLLSLVAREHCIIDTEREVLDDLENELILIAENIFGLSHATLNCSPDTTVEEFSNAILAHDAERPDYDRLSSFTSGEGGRSVDRLPFGGGRLSLDKSSSRVRTSVLDDRKVVNVIVAKNFDLAPDYVQLLALDNGFMNLEESSEWFSDDQGSISSVIRKPNLPLPKEFDEPYLIREEHIKTLRQLSDNVTLSADMINYLQNIIVFLRMNRGVASGVTATSTRHFQLLTRCLAPLQRVDYVFPSLVALAARRVYHHRIYVAEPANDRSLMYGSSLKAVDLVLAGASPEMIIEEVLADVEAPL